MNVKVKKLHAKATAPVYKTAGAAGADLCACLDEADGRIYMAPGDRALIPTGLAIELPDGYEAQVRPRSGLALKQGVTVLNSPGTIDSDYRGEIGVLLYNAGSGSFWVTHGERIAQLIVAPVVRSNFVEAELDETDRGEGGFGSTGK